MDAATADLDGLPALLTYSVWYTIPPFDILSRSTMADPFASAPHYVLRFTIKGELSHLRLGDDTISLNTPSGTLEDFHRWWEREFQSTFVPSVKPNDVDNMVLEDASFYLHPKPLFDDCKKYGVMLHAIGRGEVQTGGYSQVAGVTFNRLASMRAFDPAKDSILKEHPGGIVPDISSCQFWVTHKVLEYTRDKVGEEDHEARRVSSLTIERTFVYLDISDFSKHPPGQEGLIINSLVGLVNSRGLWNTGYPFSLFQKFEAMLCIGDGYIFVFKDPVEGTYFGAHLASLIELGVAKGKLPVNFHFRMGVHVGPVYSFWDPGRQNWNYIGEGINGGNRVLSAVGKAQDDVIFVSDNVRQKILARDDGRAIALQAA
jgi:hypothetical protein